MCVCVIINNNNYAISVNSKAIILFYTEYKYI